MDDPTVPFEPVDERHVATRTERSRFWISPGARLGLTAVILIIVMLFLFTGLPAIQAKHQNAADRADAARSRSQGVALLHRFDCTYGRAIDGAVLAAERSARGSAQVSLANRHRALKRGDRKAANISLQSRRNSQRAARAYHHLRVNLLPLGRQYQGLPVPPCSR